MIVTAKIENPGQIEITLTITMSKHYWDQIGDALENKGYPMSALDVEISRAIDKFNRTVFHEGEPNEKKV